MVTWWRRWHDDDDGLLPFCCFFFTFPTSPLDRDFKLKPAISSHSIVFKGNKAWLNIPEILLKSVDTSFPPSLPRLPRLTSRGSHVRVMELSEGARALLLPPNTKDESPYSYRDGLVDMTLLYRFALSLSWKKNNRVFLSLWSRKLFFKDTPPPPPLFPPPP